MFGYYLDLAWRSLRRNKVLTALMVVAIGLGIGASMTMLTVLHVMTMNPIPDRSSRLFYVQVDPQPAKHYTRGEEPPNQLTWIDAMNLLHAHKGAHEVAMVGGQVAVHPPQGKARAFYVDARYTSADFFRMFEVPFVAGNAWNAADDAKQARVAVISRKLADKLYAAGHAVGQTLRLDKASFRVIGVIGAWDPVPHYYDLTHGPYAHSEDVFLPLQTAIALKQSTSGSISCWANMPDDGDLRNAGCTWLQFWAQLDTPAQVGAYREFLVHYSQEQKKLGRFQRPPNVRLRDVMQWLDFNHVVPGSVQLQALLALGFMLVCLVNTVALLLVKFLRRGGELAVRRAMGASRGSIFAQLLMEGAMVGLAGGVVGLLLAWFGLWVVRHQPTAYASVAHLDVSMLVATFVLAVCATLVAALFPAWRACRLMPARLLKVQ